MSRSSKQGQIIYNDKKGMYWKDFKQSSMYKDNKDTSAYYVIRTPFNKDGTGNLIKLGISSVGSSEIAQRLGDYERYYDGNFVIHSLRVWNRYVKDTNQLRSPQYNYEQYILNQLAKNNIKPKYPKEWFKSNDFDKILNVIEEYDNERKDIQLIPPRSSNRTTKDINVKDMIRYKYKNKFYNGFVYGIDDNDNENKYWVITFNDKNRIVFRKSNTDALNVNEVIQYKNQYNDYVKDNPNIDETLRTNMNRWLSGLKQI